MIWGLCEAEQVDGSHHSVSQQHRDGSRLGWTGGEWLWALHVSCSQGSWVELFTRDRASEPGLWDKVPGLKTQVGGSSSQEVKSRRVVEMKATLVGLFMCVFIYLLLLLRKWV